MGAPEGHPFFGNQYTNGGYEPGNFSYDVEPVVEKTVDVVKTIHKTLTDKSIKTSYKEANHITHPSSSPVKSSGGKETIIIGGIVVALTTVGGFIAYKWKHRKKKETVKIENVGICSHCGKPLSGSSFHPKDEKRGIESYIQCKNCGAKNYAHYNVERKSMED